MMYGGWEKFWNNPRRLYRASPYQRQRERHLCQVPGCRGDPNDRGQPKRFDKWYKLPRKAHQLYWRHHPKTSYPPVTTNPT